MDKSRLVPFGCGDEHHWPRFFFKKHLYTNVKYVHIGYFEYKNAEYSKLLAIIGIITGLFSVMFAIGFLIVENTPIARNSVVYLSVWTATTFFMLWLIGKGLYFWKKRK